MMRFNEFQPSSEIPAGLRSVDENHPFLVPSDTGNAQPVERQYVAYIPETKKWQRPAPSQDVAEAFREVKSPKS